MKKILIVDDEFNIVELLEDLLLQKGYIVEKAYNRKQAEAAIETFQPELMLLDIKLPDGDGIEFLKQIKKNTPKIHVIMVTGLADKEIALEALKNGAADYICKPIDLLYLTNSVLANVISNYREE
ncbi:MAG: hypothetical protein COT43_06340 [Candidatus Marinimicrobia bacterium CG08_land_8_20_14_0_20_45_22]|nr:MAG: hypothetical protein COT43_06340 [Candidatus Marinimicrobia bacterium CG08_land_8_20_14_0_20_45_22]